MPILTTVKVAAEFSQYPRQLTHDANGDKTEEEVKYPRTLPSCRVYRVIIAGKHSLVLDEREVFVTDPNQLAILQQRHIDRNLITALLLPLRIAWLSHCFRVDPIVPFNREESRNADYERGAFLCVEMTITVPPFATTISRKRYKPSPILPGIRCAAVSPLRNASADRRSSAKRQAGLGCPIYGRSTPWWILPGRIRLNLFLLKSPQVDRPSGDPC